MTKRSKTTLFGLLALIAAFGLILTGCPDAAGSSTSTEYVPVPADVVKVVDVAFKDGTNTPTNASAEITFSVVLPSGSWSPVAESLPSVELKAFFNIDVPTSVASAVALYTASALVDTENPKKLNVKLSSGTTYTPTRNTRVSVGLVQSASVNINRLVEGNTALPISGAPAVWKYDDANDAALITVDEVSFRDGSTGGEPPLVTVKLRISKGTWAAALNGSALPGFVTGITVLDDTNITGYTKLVAGGGGSVLTITHTAGSATATEFEGAQVVLAPATDISTNVYSGISKVLFDLDTATTVASAVALGTGSQGVGSYKSIIGLTAGKTYLVLRTDTATTTAKWYKVQANGKLEETALTELSAAAVGTYATGLTGTAITELDEQRYVYNVYLYGVLGNGDSIDATGEELTTGGKNAVANVSALTNSQKFDVKAGGLGIGATLIILTHAQALVARSQQLAVADLADNAVLGSSGAGGVTYALTNTSLAPGTATTAPAVAAGDKYFKLVGGTAADFVGEIDVTDNG